MTKPTSQINARHIVSKRKYKPLIFHHNREKDENLAERTRTGLSNSAFDIGSYVTWVL